MLVGVHPAALLSDWGFGDFQSLKFSPGEHPIQPIEASQLADDIDPDVMAEALLHRAALREAGEDVLGAIADCTTAVLAPSMPPESIAEALLLRGTVRARSGDFGRAIDDFTGVLSLEGADRLHAMSAMLYRGDCRRLRGENAPAESDYERLLALPNVPDDMRQAARRQLSALRSIGR